MEGATVWVWGRSPQPPEARGSGGKPTALEDFAFFCKNSFRAILIKYNALKTWHKNRQRNIIQLVALMGYVGGG